MKEQFFKNSIAIRPLELIKLQLITRCLVESNLKSLYTNKTLEVLRYYDATKLSTHRHCVSDYITSTNFKKHPSALDVILACIVSTSKEQNIESLDFRRR